MYSECIRSHWCTAWLGWWYPTLYLQADLTSEHWLWLPAASCHTLGCPSASQTQHVPTLNSSFPFSLPHFLYSPHLGMATSSFQVPSQKCASSQLFSSLLTEVLSVYKLRYPGNITLFFCNVPTFLMGAGSYPTRVGDIQSVDGLVLPLSRGCLNSGRVCHRYLPKC